VQATGGQITSVTAKSSRHLNGRSSNLNHMILNKDLTALLAI
jgi:hypothetical protein